MAAFDALTARALGGGGILPDDDPERVALPPVGGPAESLPAATLGENLDTGFYAGMEGMRSTGHAFSALAKRALGSDPASVKRSLEEMRYRDEVVQRETAGIESFEDFVAEPTLSGFLDQVAIATGELAPSLALSVASGGAGALAGGLVGVVGKQAMTTGARRAARELIKDELAKKARGEALDPDVEDTLEIAYQGLRKSVAARRPDVAQALMREAERGPEVAAALRRTGTASIAKRSAFAGAAGGEYPLAAGEAGREVFDPEHEATGGDPTRGQAAGGLALGVPSALVGTGADALVLKGLAKMAAKRADATGSNVYLRTIAGAARGAGLGASLEGAVEGLQEGMTIGYRAATGGEVDTGEALMRIGEAAFKGAAGSVVPGGLGGTASGIFSTARSLRADAEKGTLADRAPGVAGLLGRSVATTGEPTTDVVAQLGAIGSPDNARHTAYFSANTVDALLNDADAPKDLQAAFQAASREENDGNWPVIEDPFVGRVALARVEEDGRTAIAAVALQDDPEGARADIDLLDAFRKSGNTVEAQRIFLAHEELPDAGSVVVDARDAEGNVVEQEAVPVEDAMRRSREIRERNPGTETTVATPEAELEDRAERLRLQASLGDETLFDLVAEEGESEQDLIDRAVSEAAVRGVPYRRIPDMTFDFRVRAREAVRTRDQVARAESVPDLEGIAPVARSRMRVLYERIRGEGRDPLEMSREELLAEPGIGPAMADHFAKARDNAPGFRWHVLGERPALGDAEPEIRRMTTGPGGPSQATGSTGMFLGQDVGMKRVRQRRSYHLGETETANDIVRSIAPEPVRRSWERARQPLGRTLQGIESEMARRGLRDVDSDPEMRGAVMARLRPLVAETASRPEVVAEREERMRRLAGTWRRSTRADTRRRLRREAVGLMRQARLDELLAREGPDAVYDSPRDLRTAVERMLAAEGVDDRAAANAVVDAIKGDADPAALDAAVEREDEIAMRDESRRIGERGDDNETDIDIWADGVNDREEGFKRGDDVVLEESYHATEWNKRIKSREIDGWQITQAKYSGVPDDRRADWEAFLSRISPEERASFEAHADEMSSAMLDAILEGPVRRNVGRYVYEVRKEYDPAAGADVLRLYRTATMAMAAPELKVEQQVSAMAQLLWRSRPNPQDVRSKSGLWFVNPEGERHELRGNALLRLTQRGKYLNSLTDEALAGFQMTGRQASKLGFVRSMKELWVRGWRFETEDGEAWNPARPPPSVDVAPLRERYREAAAALREAEKASEFDPSSADPEVQRLQKVRDDARNEWIGAVEFARTHADTDEDPLRDLVVWRKEGSDDPKDVLTVRSLFGPESAEGSMVRDPMVPFPGRSPEDLQRRHGLPLGDYAGILDSSVENPRDEPPEAKARRRRVLKDHRDAQRALWAALDYMNVPKELSRQALVYAREKPIQPRVLDAVAEANGDGAIENLVRTMRNLPPDAKDIAVSFVHAVRGVQSELDREHSGSVRAYIDDSNIGDLAEARTALAGVPKQPDPALGPLRAAHAEAKRQATITRETRGDTEAWRRERTLARELARAERAESVRRRRVRILENAVARFSFTPPQERVNVGPYLEAEQMVDELADNLANAEAENDGSLVHASYIASLKQQLRGAENHARRMAERVGPRPEGVDPLEPDIDFDYRSAQGMPGGFHRDYAWDDPSIFTSPETRRLHQRRAEDKSYEGAEDDYRLGKYLDKVPGARDAVRRFRRAEERVARIVAGMEAGEVPLASAAVDPDGGLRMENYRRLRRNAAEDVRRDPDQWTGHPLLAAVQEFDEASKSLPPLHRFDVEGFDLPRGGAVDDNLIDTIAGHRFWIGRERREPPDRTKEAETMRNLVTRRAKLRNDLRIAAESPEIPRMVSLVAGMDRSIAYVRSLGRSNRLIATVAQDAVGTDDPRRAILVETDLDGRERPRRARPGERTLKDILARLERVKSNAMEELDAHESMRTRFADRLEATEREIEELKRTAGIRGDPKKGTVSYRGSVSQQARAVGDRFAADLGDGLQMDVEIVDEATARTMDGLEWPVRRKVMEGLEAMHANPREMGFAVMEKGRAFVVVRNSYARNPAVDAVMGENATVADYDAAMQAFVAGHELGHVLWRGEMSRLHDDEGGLTRTGERLWDEFRKAQGVSEAYTNDGSGFEEWYADQVGAFLVQDAQPAMDSLARTGMDSTLIRHFRAVAERLRRWLSQVGRLVFGERFRPNELFRLYAEDTFAMYRAGQERVGARTARDVLTIQDYGIVPKRATPQQRAEARKGKEGRPVTRGDLRSDLGDVPGAEPSPEPVRGSLADPGRPVRRRIDGSLTPGEEIALRKLTVDVRNAIGAQRARSLWSAVRKAWSDGTMDGLKSVFVPANAHLHEMSPDLARFFAARSQTGDAEGFHDAVARGRNELRNRLAKVLGVERPNVLADWDTREIREAFWEAENEYRDFDDLPPKAQAVRNFLDQIYGTYVTRFVGQDDELHVERLAGTKYRKNYFPRQLLIPYLEGSVTARRDLAELIQTHAKDPETRNRAAEIVKSIVADGYDLEGGGAGGDRSGMQPGLSASNARALGFVPTTELRKAGLLQTPLQSMTSYLHEVVRRAEYEQRGGTKRITDGLKAVDPARRVAAERNVRGQLGLLNIGISPGWRKFNSSARAVTAWTTLAFAVFGSLGEPVASMVRGNGIVRYSQFARQILSTMTKDENAELARALGVVAPEALDTVFSSIGAFDGVSPVARRGMDFFFRATGLSWITQFTRELSSGMGREFLLNAARDPEKPRNARYLEQMGVTAEQVLKWDADDRPSWPEDDPMIGEAGEAHNAVRQAIARFVDETSVRPTPGSRPALGNDPRFALVYDLKSFMYDFGVRHLSGMGREVTRLVRGGEKGAAAYILLVAASLMLPIAALGLEIREALKFGFRSGAELIGVDTDPAGALRSNRMGGFEYAAEILDRSGALGPFAIAVSAWDGMRYGRNPVVSQIPIADFAGELWRGNYERAVPVASNAL